MTESDPIRGTDHKTAPEPLQEWLTSPLRAFEVLLEVTLEEIQPEHRVAYLDQLLEVVENLKAKGRPVLFEGIVQEMVDAMPPEDGQDEG